jgi:hypothetical protein
MTGGFVVQISKEYQIGPELARLFTPGKSDRTPLPPGEMMVQSGSITRQRHLRQ